jgi:hypothetical protein
MTRTLVRDRCSSLEGKAWSFCMNRAMERREVTRTATNVPGRKSIVTAARVFMEELSRLLSRATKCELLWFCCEIRLAT